MTTPSRHDWPRVCLSSTPPIISTTFRDMAGLMEANAFWVLNGTDVPPPPTWEKEMGAARESAAYHRHVFCDDQPGGCADSG